MLGRSDDIQVCYPPTARLPRKSCACPGRICRACRRRTEHPTNHSLVTRGEDFTARPRPHPTSTSTRNKPPPTAHLLPLWIPTRHETETEGSGPSRGWPQRRTNKNPAAIPTAGAGPQSSARAPCGLQTHTRRTAPNAKIPRPGGDLGTPSLEHRNLTASVRREAGLASQPSDRNDAHAWATNENTGDASRAALPVRLRGVRPANLEARLVIVDVLHDVRLKTLPADNGPRMRPR